jgi:hypothetical protein
MKWTFGLLPALCALILIATLTEAKPTVKFNVTSVSEHQTLVTFEWRVSIFSDKTWDGCDLRISFQDSKGQEIFFVKEILKLKTGHNEFSGMDICSRDIWKRTVKRVATLDCQF